MKLSMNDSRKKQNYANGSYGMISNNPRSVNHRKWGAEQIYYMSNKLYEKGWIRVAYFLKFLNTFLFRNYIPPMSKLAHDWSCRMAVSV